MDLKLDGKYLASWPVDSGTTSQLQFEGKLETILAGGQLNTFTLSRRSEDKMPIAIGEVAVNFLVDVPVFGWNTLTTAIKQ